MAGSQKKTQTMTKELINTTAGFLSTWRDVGFVDQYNPQVAIDTLTSHEDFDGDIEAEECWFATIKIDGVLCAAWGNGSMTGESTPIQYVQL